MHVHIVLCCGAITNKLSEYWCHIINLYIPVYKVLYVKAFRYESYTNMHVHSVLYCGGKRVLFTNKLSECWCRISNPYLFTKFHASQHFGKSKLACPIVMYGPKLFIVVFQKVRCLPKL